MGPYILTLCTGLLFLGGYTMLSLFRGEGFPLRFTYETVFFSILYTSIFVLREKHPQPVFFLIILYGITMRVRLLIDLANVISRRGNYYIATKLYRLAEYLWPDKLSQQIIYINQAASLIRKGMPYEAIPLLEGALSNRGSMTKRYEAAACYNLGLAFIRIGEEGKGRRELEKVVSLAPGSVYSLWAKAYLQRQ